jgi:DNA polymerase III subunit delta
VKANPTEMARALDAPAAHIRFYLLYGPDESGSAALAKRLERAMGADAERIDLDGATLKGDPARLSDEAASFSLFGGKRYIRIQPATEDCVPAVTALLEADTAGNPVIAIAGALKPTSALLKLALAEAGALATISYVPDADKMEAITQMLGREVGLRIPAEIARALSAAGANDRAVIGQEIEKIALFLDAGPERPVEVTDAAVEAVGAKANDGELSRLIDAVMDGRPDVAALELSRLAEDGVEGIPVLRAISRRIVLLAAIRAEVDGGASAMNAVKARGKAIFWKEEAAVARQAGRWVSAKLARAADRLIAAERALKSSGNAGNMLCDAEVIAISRAAPRSR